MTSPLLPRLTALIQAAGGTAVPAHDARGWLDLAYEGAYGERYRGAAEAAEAGLRSPGSDDPENQLMLLRILAGVHEMRGDSEASAPFCARRIELLRSLGRSRQARVEEDLGPMLLREPDRVEGEILARVAEDLRAEDEAAGTPSVELADVLSSLAVRRLQDEGPEATLPLVRETCTILEQLDHPEALAGARMFLAHTLLLCGEPEESLSTAELVVAAPTNRAVRGAMAMLQATIHHHQDRNTQAIEAALSSVELYAAAQVRKGAASAAALLGGLTSEEDDGEASVLAWRIAVQQAELGEFSESRLLSLALGQQLLELEDHAEAEKVLDALSVRLAGTDEDRSTRARALMGLGHAVTQLRRPVEAMSHWNEAAELFLEVQESEEAARAHLAAGALAASLERLDLARSHYEQGLKLVERTEDMDPLVLLQALHSLGHLLTRSEDQAGIAHLDRALNLAAEHGTTWQRADITDSLARGWTALGEGTKAVAAGLEAADLFVEAGDDDAAGDAEVFAAKVLLEMGRADEAETIFRMSTDEREASPSLMADALEGQIEALMRQGKAEAAADLRRKLTRLKRRMRS
ncbi:tetratricopeptide repeat protein [Nesterenkonia halotolerans]|uniref:Tetratricopeptide (TPR) repeat protein n=1 Tax=Nesterenkonia halotolerans TaxID=225325 RepID=A0ABR9JA25_9MICC|nr:hypothetical protein [Nesterenkonia halotolerans]MBE1515852.1 tetratricopeptide (TPR) repeat protein [Nesterenkonia halotolerans]